MTNVFDKMVFSRGVNSDTGEIGWTLEPIDIPMHQRPGPRTPGPRVKMNREELQQLYDVIDSDLREHDA
ncbi:MAG: hypothetical protein U9Q07_04145 [Planctomycetota bacterium]|nr:hypothetical protein [Planctomycetota bacterium]